LRRHIDIKVAQELLRHSSSRTTLDIYTRAPDQQREANLKFMELMLPPEVRELQHPSAPSKGRRRVAGVGKPMPRKGILVDLVGIEPTTSSMPWNSSNRKI
jgi:hypothetical protein